jgi:hypothetical protein
MNFFKLAASSCAVLAAVAFTACGDSSSTSSDDGKVAYDCTVKGGVKVVSPAAGESFKLGETIKIVFGSDMNYGGFGVEIRFKDGEKKVNLFEESIDDAVIDGKTCNEYSAVLDAELGVEAADDAYIYVYPYSNQAKAGKSGTFKVTK